MSKVNFSEILKRLDKAKAAFSAFAGEEPAVPKPTEENEPATGTFKDYTLQDGSTIAIDKLEIGGNVQTVDPAGAMAVAPAGDYTLTDGTVVTVDENSAIIAVKPAETETPEELQTQLRELAEAVESQKSSFAAQEAEVKKELEAVKAEFAEFKKQTCALMLDAVEAVKAAFDAPAEEAIEKPKNVYSEKEKDAARKRAAFLETVKTVGGVGK